uniref:Uncharacterized protein n=1 Tax=Heterorhabditis bacteriophora TaxID=37862 RepID=A0A1I7WZ18_HETBA
MPRSPPFREVRKSQEAIASAHRSIEARPLLLRAQKNREKNSPLNLLSSESSKLTVQVHPNLPLSRWSTPGLHIGTINDWLLLNMRRSKWDRHLDHHTLRLADYRKTTIAPAVLSAYFGWQLLNSYPSDEFGKKKKKEMETPPSHGEESILACLPDFA